MRSILQKACQQYRERVAVSAAHETITYRELDEKARKVAHLLKQTGASPVILYGGHSIAEIIAVLGCIYCNRAYVPVHGHMPLSRLLSIKNITKSTLVISDRPLTAEDCAFTTGITYEKLLEEAELIPAETLQTPAESNPSEDCAYMIFTSGSTGVPKGVPITYANLRCFVSFIEKHPPFHSFEAFRVLNQAALSFDLSVADLYYSLCNGHTWIAGNARLFDEENATDIFRKEKIQLAFMTPTGMGLCLLEQEFCEKNLPDFRCVYFCGERLQKRIVRTLWERFPSLHIINAYGPTEATSAVCLVELTKDMLTADNELPVGITESASASIRISEGEIILSGAPVFHGYLGSADSHLPGKKEYATGDLGEIRGGLLYCNGRIDSQIKYKGYRIELTDIEANLEKLPGIAAAAVTAPRNAAGIVKTLHAYCVPADEALSETDVKQELKKLLPDYMIPKTIHFVQVLPVTQNGKLDRKALGHSND